MTSRSEGDGMRSIAQRYRSYRLWGLGRCIAAACAIPPSWLIAAGVLAGLLLGFMPAAWSHEHWINRSGYTGADGIHCCGEKDCPQIAPERIKTTAHGLLLLDYGNELVPWSEITPSEDGKIYRCQRYDGARRCFFASPGGV
jgi:hypothetical protein